MKNGKIQKDLARMLQLENVVKKYETKAGTVNALDGVSLTFPSSGLVFISGKSGCGKTTLLNVIGGLDGIDGGEIYVQDKKFSSFSSAEYDSYRNTFIGFVFQEYNLLSEFTVEKNIKMAMELQGQEVDESALEQLLKDMDLIGLKNRKPAELSGGQRQRVAIARALVKQPRIIMADEPTGALDSGTGVQVLETLKRLSKDKLVIVVSHDREFAENYADRIIRLVDGKVVEDISFIEREVAQNVSEQNGTLIVKDGAELSSDEKDTLAKAIKERKKVEITEKPSFRDKRETGRVEKPLSPFVPFKKSKMKMKSSVTMGAKSLAVKPIRLMITVLISALAFAVFGLFDTVANFNTRKILLNQMESSYTTVVTTPSYTQNYEAGDEYSLKVSQDTVDRLSSETGGKVKGIFDFNDNTSGNVTHTQMIAQLATSSVVSGRKYYANSVNGFIEFDASAEINADGNFKDFNYKVVKGKYPKLRYNESQVLIEESLFEVAISSYLADSIIYYLDGEPLDEQQEGAIAEYDDLLNKQIRVGSISYTIVAIIDCGQIDEKYDVLKTSAPSNISLSALSDDYNAYINSGAWRCLFVGSGFQNAYNQRQNSATVYYLGNAEWSMVAKEDSNFKLGTHVYNVNEISKDKVVFFNGGDANGNKVTLADDEILIRSRHLENLFSKEIYSLKKVNKDRALSIIRNPRQDTIDELLILLGKKQNANQEYAFEGTLVQNSTKTPTQTAKDIKIVGVFFGVDEDKWVQTSTYQVMMNENLMQDFYIFPEQGDYNKILFSSKSVQSGANKIVDYVIGQQGLTMQLYNNSILGIISENETLIKQVADLFLYVALALAVFSIFMLYNYISTSISNKKRSVGVLRGLGAGSKDVLRIFLSESLIIAIVNALFACVFSAVGCVLVNSYIMNVMNIFVAFALFGVRQILIISGVSLITAFLSSVLPIIKIARKKPVDLIARS